jgi:hypothetical protein
LLNIVIFRSRGIFLPVSSLQKKLNRLTTKKKITKPISSKQVIFLHRTGYFMYLDRLDVRFRLNVIIFMHVYFVFVYLQSNFMVVFFPSLLCEGISLKHNNAPTLLFFHFMRKLSRWYLLFQAILLYTCLSKSTF